MKCSSCGLLVPEGQTCYCQWGAQRTYAPHRLEPSKGGTVLTLGVLSLVLCAVFGPFAWSMGSAELRRIDAGHVDPSGRGSAQAGMVCGIISTALMVIGIVALIAIAASAPTPPR